MLLHAFPLSAAMWEPQIECFAAAHRVVAPDLLGFGESAVPPEPDAYSLEGWADDIAALLGALRIEHAVLVGLSMGGYVAFAFLRRRGAALAGMLLADTRAAADSAEIRSKRERQQRLLAAAANPVELAQELVEPLVGRTSSRRDETLATARRLLASNPTDGVIGALEALKTRPDFSDDLGKIRVPTSVVVGDQDQPSPPEVAEAMARDIPGAAFVVIPDAGHLSNLENPSAFNEALAALLARV